MLSLPQRSHMIMALVIAGVFAFPMTTLISCMVVFPILFYGALAIVVNAGIVAVPVLYALERAEIFRVDRELWHKWLLAAIVWTGCAIGFANWGAVGSMIGAKNKPFLDVFFSPILIALGYPVG